LDYCHDWPFHDLLLSCCRREGFQSRVRRYHRSGRPQRQHQVAGFFRYRQQKPTWPFTFLPMIKNDKKGSAPFDVEPTPDRQVSPEFRLCFHSLPPVFTVAGLHMVSPADAPHPEMLSHSVVLACLPWFLLRSHHVSVMLPAVLPGVSQGFSCVFTSRIRDCSHSVCHCTSEAI